MPSGKLQIFISSPGDVLPERVLAERVIQRLAYEFAAHVELKAVRWERQPMQATRHFQHNIVRPSSTDIVVVILWSKLGTDLPFDAFPGPLSGAAVTGTEWEFEEAALASRQTGRPDLLVYRKTKTLSVPVDDDDEEEALRAQMARAKRFVRRWFTDDKTGAFKNAYRTFNEPDQLESMLHDHLRELIQRKVDAGAAGHRKVAWTQGSPFRGLQSFEVGDGLIFHGRTRARHELREALVAQQKRGCAFIVVVGASGSGKSSLVKAGLINDIRIPGLVEGVGLCRYAIMRPGNARAGLCDQLSRAMFEPHALPELARQEHNVESLGAALVEAPRQVVPAVKLALKAAAEHSELPAHASAMLVVVVDQLEEMFTTSGLTDKEAFVAALDALAQSGVVWVVTTLRSDFLPRMESIPRLAELAAGGGNYLLSAPRDAEVAQMIRLPAEAAGLSFEVDSKTGLSLDEEVRRAAGLQAGSLPLLEYVLDRLWHARTKEGILTFAAYEALGGVEKTLATRAEAAFQTLPREAQDAFPTVLRALVTVQPGDEAKFNARTAPLDAFPEGTPARKLIDAFQRPDERLLVIDADRRIRVAHEALFTHWQRASNQLSADRRALEVRAVLEQDAERWACSTGSGTDSLLLPPGIRLAEAKYLLEHRAPDLSALIIDYVRQSIAADKSRRELLEWERLDAEAAKLRAMVEEKDMRAYRNDSLAARLEAQDEWPEKAEYLDSLRRNARDFRAQAEKLWKQASAIEDQLRDHPGAPTREQKRKLPQSAVFALEMIDASGGEVFIVHYGRSDSVHLALIDGGTNVVFKQRLAPRLADLRDQMSPHAPLPLELVMISHGDEDRLRGIIDLLQSMEKDRQDHRPDRYRIHRLWYNHFLPIDPEGRRSSRVLRRGQVPSLARALGIRLNRPFDYYVMPAESGPARVMLPGDLSITVICPLAQRVTNWHRLWKREASRMNELLGPDSRPELSLADQLGGALSDGFSSPEVALLRAKAYAASPSTVADASDRGAADTFIDKSITNLASLVTVFEIYGRSMLLTGDARGDDIIQGLEDGGYLSAQRPAHLDLLKLPHWGSTHNLTAAFFKRVAAEHYVIAGNSRFRLPKADILEMIAASRGANEFHVHISMNDEAAKRELTTAFDRLKAEGSKGVLHFLQAGAASHLIDLT